MIYILKFIGASAFLYAIYYTVLRNEKTFRFNRIYLLLILVLAAAIPLIIVKSTIVEVPVQELTKSIAIDLLTSSTQIIDTQEDIKTQFEWSKVYKTTYGVISLLLLFRFLINLNTLHNIKKTGQSLDLKGLKLVSSSKISSTFSFLNRVFVNSEELNKLGIADEILEHERIHIRQKHSLDIIIIELATCLLWFNPLIYFIKKSIKLNHEYLADEGVISISNDPSRYQKLLLKHSSRQIILNPLLASHLNYGETKQRFKIMFKTTNKRTAALKQLTALSLTTALVFILGEEQVIAQSQNTPPPPPPREAVNIPPPPPPSKYLAEAGLNSDTQVRFRTKDGEIQTEEYGNLTESQKTWFSKPEAKGQLFLNPLPAMSITSEMLNDYKDAKEYGVWIDGERVENSVLNNYKASDFYNFFKSKLLKNAAHYGQYTYHLNLNTKEKWNSRSASKGTWIDYQKPKRIENGKQNKISDQKQRQLNQNSQSLTKKEFINSLKKDQLIRFTAINGQLIEKEFQSISNEELKLFESNAKGSAFLMPVVSTETMSSSDWNDLANTKKYGIWLNGDKIANSELTKYSPDDIYLYDIRNGKHMKNLGDFEFQYFALTKAFVKENYSYKSRYGYWLDLNTHVQMLEEVASMTAARN